MKLPSQYFHASAAVVAPDTSPSGLSLSREYPGLGHSGFPGLSEQRASNPVFCVNGRVLGSLDPCTCTSWSVAEVVVHMLQFVCELGEVMRVLPIGSTCARLRQQSQHVCAGGPTVSEHQIHCSIHPHCHRGGIQREGSAATSDSILNSLDSCSNTPI